MISDIKLLELLRNQPELDHKMIIGKYIPFICKLVFTELSIKYTKEDIEKYLRSVFFDVFNYKDIIDSQSGFNKVLLAIMEKRKIADMNRKYKNNNEIFLESSSVELHNISDDVARLVLFKESNLQLIDHIKSFDESDSEIITKKYSLNQKFKDNSKNTGSKVSIYA